MKWIGQNIYDLIARFRSDVYLESISSGTIASGGYLGLDSNNKIVKATSEGDITGITLTAGTGVDLTSISGATGGAYAATVGVDVSDFMSDGADNRVLTATGADAIQAETYLTFENTGNVSGLYNLSNQDTGDYLAITTTTHGRSYIVTHDDDATAAHLNIAADGDLTLDSAGDIALEARNVTIDANELIMTSATDGFPALTLQTTHTTKGSSAELQFKKDAVDTEDGENLGLITFYGENESNINIKFAHIKGAISESDNAAEGGSIKLAVATHDGEMQNGLIIQDGDAEDEIDVTIGNTATSLTTITGTLTMGSTAFVNNSGVVQVATQGTIDHNSLANYVAAEHVRWATASAGTIHSTNIPTLNQDTTGSAATLTNARDFRVALGSTSVASFDGSANVSPGVSGTLALSNGGTGQTTAQAALNALAGAVTDGRFLQGNGSNIILGAITASDVPTLNQDTTGSAATLTASTSNALGIGSIELGHADDTTIARSAAGIVSVEGKNIRTEDKHLFIKQGSFSINPGTSEIYFPMTGTAENTSPNGVSIPFIAPVDGKLLKIHFRSNKDHSGFNQTFTLVNWDNNETFTTGNASDIGAKTVTGVATNNVITVDFTTGLDSGTNVFTVGEMIALSVTNASSIGSTTKYLFTAVFEFDFSSY